MAQNSIGKGCGAITRNPFLLFARGREGGDMPDQIVALNLSLTGTKEQRPDRWTIYCNTLGFIVYGSTEEEADNAFGGAVKALVESFAGDLAGIETWLAKKGVEYSVIVQHPPAVREEVESGRGFFSHLRLELASATA